MKKHEAEKFLETWLEEESLEDILEKFDVDPVDAFILIYEAGLIDEELLESYKICD